MNPVQLSDRFSHQTIKANGVNLHYVIGGQGTPILLWHGFLETWYCWRKIMPKLAEQYTVIAPDMRGYGDSDKPSSGYDARSLSEDFHQLIGQLGFEKVHLVAHDMGAPPALIYANDYPDEVLSLSYLEEPVLLNSHLEQLFKFSSAIAQNGGLWWWTFFLAPDLPETLIAGHEREFLTYFYKTYCFNSSSIEPEAIDEYLRTFATPDGIRGALGVYRAISESIQQTELLAENPIQTPVLALGGEKVSGATVKTMVQSVATDVRGGSVDRCGHFIPDERPDELIEQLLDFFQAIQQSMSIT
jgi:pimeloyl-ACP methyl ester carboxylesterase